jgi:hypothetical protein
MIHKLVSEESDISAVKEVLEKSASSILLSKSADGKTVLGSALLGNDRHGS